MEQYKYYAFISYSRKNSSAAAYLHKSLERFRIPVKYVPEELRPAGQKYLRPIFRDRRDLEVSEGNFTDDIRTAIEQSRYLIVLCSPDAAQSVWVNEEVKHFLATHNNDIAAVVPVILTGKPGHGGNEECLPPDLCVEQITGRNLSSMIPDEGEPERSGWENGVVQALSYMLRVNREKIKATVDAERIRLLRLNLLIGAIFLLGFAALTLWAIRAERAATANEQLAQENEAKASANAEEAKRNAEEARANEQRAIAGEKLAQENEAKAKKQAEIAKKSLEFLRDMFQSSDPSKKGNKDMKVLDAIRAKIPEIEKLEPWQLRESVAFDIGRVLNSLGEYEEALRLLNIAHELNLKYRPESGEAATSYNNIGFVYDAQGNYTKALECHNKALAIRLKVLGENHPDTATSYNNIGAVYYNQGNYAKALEYYNKALAIELKVLGETHPSTATSYNNIGAVYYNQGNYAKALEYYEKALVICLKVYGENHADTATSYNNIGLVYDAQGNYAKALEYHHKALAIVKKAYGENHPLTATSYNNIGLVYGNQNIYAKALEYREKALAIFLKIHGENHPDIAASYYNIGVGFYRSGKKEEARDHLRKAVEIAKKTLGPDHPYTKRFSANLQTVENELKK